MSLTVNRSVWSHNELEWFKENYPFIGLYSTMEKLNRTKRAVLTRAWMLGIKSRVKFSEESNYRRGIKNVGKKRPEHSEFMKKYRAERPLVLSEESKRKMSIAKKQYFQTHPHTRGFTGGKHSEESLRKISLASIQLHKKRTKEEEKQRIEKTLKTKMKRYGSYGGSLNVKNPYSRAKRGFYDINGKNIYFRSLWEANYALYLDFLIKQNKIVSWKFESKTFWFEKIKRGVRSYTPDFEVVSISGEIEYHEVKGWMDKKSVTKIKRMNIYFPDVKLFVIDQYCYKDIKNKVGKLLKFYE